jgi:FixJ family two-component response regulator
MDTTSNVSPDLRLFSMARVTPTVFVVDDDLSIRESLESLLTRAGWRAVLFASAEEFLASPRASSPSCLILDMSLPDLNGLELQQRIAVERSEMPIIFITGYGDIPMSVRAMKAGAVEFLTKPYTAAVLLQAIKGALENSRVYLLKQANLQALRDLYEALTRREQEVMGLVVRGQLNKQIAGQLGICEITVKQHRARVMHKMRARSLPELVNIAARLGLETAGKG